MTKTITIYISEDVAQNIRLHKTFRHIKTKDIAEEAFNYVRQHMNEIDFTDVTVSELAKGKYHNGSLTVDQQILDDINAYAKQWKISPKYVPNVVLAKWFAYVNAGGSMLVRYNN